MMLIFFALALISFQPITENVSEPTNAVPHVLLLDDNTTPYQVVLAQETSQYDEENENESEVPYGGFNVIAVAMILLTVLVVAFVVYKVFQRMNKSRKGDQ